MFVTLILNENFEREGGTVFDITRLIPIGISIAAGIGALGLSLRALSAGRERSIVVWAALAIGLLIATVVVAESAGLME